MKDVNSQLEMLGSALQGIAGSGPSLSELNMLVAEMRLILPNRVVKTAEWVSSVTLGITSLGGALPLAARLHLGGILTAALNVFVNEIRREAGLEYYLPEPQTLDSAAKRLEALAKEQAVSGRAR